MNRKNQRGTDTGDGINDIASNRNDDDRCERRNRNRPRNEMRAVFFVPNNRNEANERRSDGWMQCDSPEHNNIVIAIEA